MRLFINLFILILPLALHADDDCERFLSTKGAPLPVTAVMRTKADGFQAFLREMFARESEEPQLHNLQHKRMVDLPRAMQLVAALKDPKSDLNLELEQHLQSLGGMQSQKLWDTYFRSYDRIVAFTEGFLDLATAMDIILPQRGVVGDFGSGTGNIMAHLALESSRRHLIGVDFSSEGLRATRAKFQFLNRPVDLIQGDLARERLPENSLDGAVMNNVLYTMGPNRLEALRNIYAALQPGASFVLNDILDVMVKDREKMVQFLSTAALQAIAKKAPVTEYDLALVGKINTMVLLNPTNAYLSADKLLELVKQAGFEVRGFYTSYYGSAAFLHLAKPL